MGKTTERIDFNGPVGNPSREEVREQVLHIIASTKFRNAPLLGSFLHFITSKTIEGQIAELTEYTIATDALGRKIDFDPTTDTIVRTEAYRLRLKLKEYYETDGKSDRLVIELPKGHYVPVFSLNPRHGTAQQESEKPQPLGSPAATPPGMSAAESTASKRKMALTPRSAILIALLLFFAGAFARPFWFMLRNRPATLQNGSELLKSFWKGIAGESNTIILAYTNTVFLETEAGDLLRFRGGAAADRGSLVSKQDSLASALNPSLANAAGPLYYEDAYTGTGEVLSVQRITSLLSPLGANVLIKRGLLVNATDLRNRTVIFLGSPFENRFLAEIHLPMRFVFEEAKGSPYLWNGRIVDTRGDTSVSRFYELQRDPHTHVILADYALFDVLPGIAPGQRVVILAGLTTSGTEGACEFATSAVGLHQVLANLGAQGGSRNALPDYFECLLRVEVTNGLDVIKVNWMTGTLVGEKSTPFSRAP
jgi:hypothetical protein